MVEYLPDLFRTCGILEVWFNFLGNSLGDLPELEDFTVARTCTLPPFFPEAGLVLPPTKEL